MSLFLSYEATFAASLLWLVEEVLKRAKKVEKLQIKKLQSDSRMVECKLAFLVTAIKSFTVHCHFLLALSLFESITTDQLQQ